MTQSELETMATQLLALPPNERLFLGERLVESVDCFASPEIAEAWSAEVASRLADYESGKSPAFRPRKFMPKSADGCDHDTG